MHIKKAWNLYVFIGHSEVFDYLLHQITTYKSTPMAGATLLVPGEVEKCRSFQNDQISPFRFFLFFNVHINLCVIFHWRLIWLVLCCFSVTKLHIIFETHFKSVFCI